MDGLGIAKADVAGWSMGGNEITAMAGKHPERINRIVYLDGGKLTQWCRHLDGRGLRTSPSWPPVTARPETFPGACYQTLHASNVQMQTQAV